MTLTPYQQSVLDQFQKFLNSDDNVLVIKGSAGTGKTTLVKTMLESLSGKRNCVLMAPTGRAAFTLGRKTETNASTIHRTIYKIEEGLTDEGDGQMKFALRNNEDAPSAVYFVDEASMIANVNNESELFKFGSGFLLNDLFEYCNGRKIVFIGDYAQLPPVGQSISPALSAEYLKEHFNASCQDVFLKEVVRQIADSLILKNANAIRDSIEKDVFNTFIINDGDDVNKTESIISDYNKYTSGTIDENAIVIAYTNKQALQYNCAIRESMFSDKEERLFPGELLLVSQNNYAYKEELFNGTIVRVLDASTNGMVEKRKVKFYTREKNEKGESVTKEVELAFRSVKIETHSHDQIDCYILDNFLNEPSGNLSNDLRQALFVDFRNRMAEVGIKPSHEEYKIKMRTDKYFNALICKYGYAITCHKAQGGEWDKVFVDMHQNRGKSNSDYFRWIYTALTRGKDKIWHYAAPNFNTTSNINVLKVSKVEKLSVVYYVPEGVDFLDWHYQNISALCEMKGISCSEDRSKNYQHLITFKKDNLECIYQIWYTNKGYGVKRLLYKKNDDGFAAEIKNLIDYSLVPENLNYVPDTDFSKELYDNIVEMTSELNVPIFNVRNELWKDVYYLKTAPYESIVAFSYNSDGFYSTITAQSTGGVEDTLLESILNKFR